MFINALWYITVTLAVWGSSLGGITVPGLGLLFPYRVLSLVLGVILLVKLKKDDLKIDKSIFKTVIPLALAMALLAAISLIWAEDKLMTVKAVMNFFFVIVFLALFFQMNKDKKVFHHMLIALSLNFAIILIMGCYEVFSANYLLSEAARLSYMQRINPYGLRYPAACFSNTNDFAFNIVLFMPLMLYTLDEVLPLGNKLRKGLKISVIVITFFVLMNASSRIGYIAYTVAALIYFGLQIKKSKTEIVVLALMLCFVFLVQEGVLSNFMGPIDNSSADKPEVQDKLTAISAADTSTDVRITVFKKGLRIICDTYGLGAGAKNSPALMRNYTDFPTTLYDVTDYHFFYMELIAEYGALILIWFLLFQGSVILRSIAVLRKVASDNDRLLLRLCLPSAAAFVFASACSSSCMFSYAMWIQLAIWSYALYNREIISPRKVFNV